ncbi:MAG: DUF177 domain-containing protein [Bacteroidales bacterium]|nr:DUF177 domain-containing protein [Bacteroidales bacterium]
MDALQAYKIGFSGLAIGNHLFSFDIDKGFFECFPQSEINLCAVHLDLKLAKESNMLVLDFLFSGWVALDCDRCLDSYRENIDQEQRLYIKFGNAYAEQSEDIVVIPYGESHIDISQFVYEFLHLGLPIQRAHQVDGDGRTECNREMLDKMKQHAPQTKSEGTTQTGEGSAWDSLKSLQFNKEEDN